jgi:hypothetical protein
MFGFGRAKDPTTAFWQWFGRNYAAIRRDVMAFDKGTPRIELAVIALGKKLEGVHPSLVHEIGMASETTLELIISANGDVAAFGQVTSLVGAAPPLRDLLLTAFRPRRPCLAIEVAGQTFGGQDVRYRARPQGTLLALELLVNGDLSDHDLATVGYLLLHQALGEYDTETGIGGLDIQCGAPTDARPLSELAIEYDAFRNASVH